MTDELNSNASNDDVFIAQADEFDDNLDAELPKWPKVVGILSIVWGSLTVICNGIGGAWYGFLQPMMLNMAQDNGQFTDGLPPQLLQTHLPMAAMSVVGVLMSILLVVAGVATVGRKISGRMLHLSWAGMVILLTIVSTSIGLSLQGQIQQWMNDNPNTQFAQSQSAGNIVMTVVMLIIFMFWPVFVLVWFGLKKKTQDDMTGGVDLDTI